MSEGPRLSALERGSTDHAGSSTWLGEAIVPHIRDLPSSSTTFRIGDHLRVRRRLGYFHHGVYVGDDMVVQFGGRIGDKPRAAVGVVSFEEFKANGRVERVEPLVADRWSGHFVPEHDEPERIVRRALWLVHHYPKGRYNLLGNNCETMADWCVTGLRPESRQVLGCIYISRLAIAYPMILVVIPRLGKRRKWSSGQLARVQLLAAAVALAPTLIWAWHNIRFLNSLRDLPPDLYRELLRADRARALTAIGAPSPVESPHPD